MTAVSNRARLAKLLRFHSSKSPANLTSLEGYVSRLQPGQKSIYWIAGMNQEEVAGSPFAEKLVAEVSVCCRHQEIGGRGGWVSACLKRGVGGGSLANVCVWGGG
jgi:HSP90 family molecular chaperone